VDTLVVTIGSRPYRLRCGPGEAARLEMLAQRVDECARRTTRAHGNLPEGMLLLLVSLTLADEAEDAEAEIERMRGEVEAAAAAAARRGAEALRAAAARLGALVERVELAGEEIG
jgi:cell division protein ZapA